MAIMLQALGSSVVHCDEICHHSSSQGYSLSTFCEFDAVV